MQIKKYFITDRTTWEANHKFMYESHWVFLPLTTAQKAQGITQPTNIMVVGKFAHDSHEIKWNAISTVDQLPHMLSRKTLSAKHVEYLAHAGVTSADSTFDAMEKFAAHHKAPLHMPY